MRPMLECIDKVCREHHLRYYLWAGTMLGAVRHKGFIPWDDDMDICMPRPDYDLLLAHCHEWMPAPFEVVGPHNRSDYPYPFAKVEDSSTTVLERPDFNFPEGIYVDIFPIDGIPSDKAVATKHLKKYKFWRHLLFFRGRDPFKHGKGPRSWWPLLIHKMYSLQQLQDKVRRRPCQSHEVGCKRSGLLVGVHRTDKIQKIYIHQTVKTVHAIASRHHKKQIQHNFYYINLELPYREFAKQNNITIA